MARMLARMECDGMIVKTRGSWQTQQHRPFAERVESVLRQWGFPAVEHVHFDTNTKDLVVSGKGRTSYGKGLTAITQSAFRISLMQYCVDNDLAHPRIVVLDFPLLSYRELDSAEDDLSETNLSGNFYRYFLGLESDRQAIIVENMDHRPMLNSVIGSFISPQWPMKAASAFFLSSPAAAGARLAMWPFGGLAYRQRRCDSSLFGEINCPRALWDHRRPLLRKSAAKVTSGITRVSGLSFNGSAP